MANDIFTNAVELLQEAGVLDVILPFLIVFVLVYAVSRAVPHLNESGDNKIRGVIAVVIGLMVIIPHATESYPEGMDVVEIINESIPQVALFLVAIVLSFMLVAATSFGEENSKKIFNAYWVKGFALIIVGLIFFDNIGTQTLSSWPFMEWFGNEDFQALILVILIFGLIVYFITRDDSNKTGQKGKHKCPVCHQEFNTEDEAKEHLTNKINDNNDNQHHEGDSNKDPIKV